MFNKPSQDRDITARAVSISEVAKRQFSLATGADFNRLLTDRAYTELHRPALTAFFEDQVKRRPQLPHDHFLAVVKDCADLDVLLITGIRDDVPLTTFSHLMPSIRLLEIRVMASDDTKFGRRGCDSNTDNRVGANIIKNSRNKNNNEPDLEELAYRPSLFFNNDQCGDEGIRDFGKRCLLPFIHKDLQHLNQMVRQVVDFPRPGINFRHVLGIAQQPGGLALCTTLLETHFFGEWSQVGAVVCCEAGGFIFASPLATQMSIHLVLIRESGKLPPPIVSVVKPSSYISSPESINVQEKAKWLEIERDLTPRICKW